MTQPGTDVTLQTKLIYPHGTEIENHLILKKTGTVLVGNDLLTIWEAMFLKAFDYLKEIKAKKKGPSAIINKITKIETEEVEKHERKLKFIFVYYKLGKETIKINAFGPDPNISQITWLLELVTPPCEYLEELDWWTATLYESAMVGLRTLEPQVVLLPIGLNPMEERYRSGLSCGSHHHIGITDKKEKIAVYNLFRNFVPHLIALSATSPFINQEPKGTPKIRDMNGKKQIIGRYTHSNRLANNTGQIGPNIPEYLPILKDTDTKDAFSKYVKKSPPDDRMVDVYPFTDYNTIELRFFDAQPYPENRLAIVLLLQALALKAKNLVKSKTSVPTASSSVLFENRQKSIEMGLLAQYTIDASVNSEFNEFYNYNRLSGKKATRLLDSVTSMILYLRDELTQFNRSDIINYLLVPFLGTKELEPPLAISEYLIYQYASNNNDLQKFFSQIYYQNPSTYSLEAISSIADLQIVPISGEESDKKPLTNLSSKLRSDLQSRRSPPIKKLKVSSKRSLASKKKESSTEKSIDRTFKKPVQKTVKTIEPKKVEEEIEEPEESTIVELQELPISMRGKIQIESKTREQEEEKVQISAFDKIEEEDIYVPAIEIEAKYTKIESKIANVMRKRREDIELKKKELYREHLETDRVDFNPKLKNVKLAFPGQISGKNVFGYITIDWQKNAVFKLRNNPLYFYLDAQTEETVEKRPLKTVSMMINVQRSLEKNSSSIPLLFSVDDLQGEISISITAVTSTNELLFKNQTFKVKRKDEINVKIDEFYINGDFGPSECTFQMLNNNGKLKGDFDLFLAVPDYEQISFNSSSLNLEQNEVFQNFNFVDLDAIYHSTPFYIVSQIAIGRLKKTFMFEAIRIKPTTRTVVEWDILTAEGLPDFTESGRRKYDLKFVFSFFNKLPPLSISIFMNTLPEGATKNIINTEVKRDIDENDGYMVSKSIKLPKNCEYLYFDVEIKTKNGFIPIDLISEPFGYPVDM